MRTAGWPILDHQILRPTRTPGNPANAPGSQSRPRPGIMWWWQAATESAISTVSMKWPLWSIRLSQLILQGSLYFPVFLGVKHHFLALKTGCMVLALQTCMLGEEVTENLRLSIASSRGHLEVVRLLLDAGAKLEHSGSHSSGHPLLLAAQRGNLEVLRMLIAAGPCWVDVRLTWSYHVDPSYPQVTNSYPHISPILRSKMGQGKFVYIDSIPTFSWQTATHPGGSMITGADVNRATNLGYTPLLVATQRGRELHFCCNCGEWHFAP